MLKFASVSAFERLSSISKSYWNFTSYRFENTFDISSLDAELLFNTF